MNHFTQARVGSVMHSWCNRLRQYLFNVPAWVPAVAFPFPASTAAAALVELVECVLVEVVGLSSDAGRSHS